MCVRTRTNESFAQMDGWSLDCDAFAFASIGRGAREGVDETPVAVEINARVRPSRRRRVDPSCSCLIRLFNRDEGGERQQKTCLRRRVI